MGWREEIESILGILPPVDLRGQIVSVINGPLAGKQIIVQSLPFDGDIVRVAFYDGSHLEMLLLKIGNLRDFGHAKD